MLDYLQKECAVLYFLLYSSYHIYICSFGQIRQIINILLFINNKSFSFLLEVINVIQIKHKFMGFVLI